MSYWSWEPSLSIGIDVIDGQHRRIVDYLNELDVAHLENDREKVSQVLAGLVDYTITHFAFEENLMKQAGYPISDSHIEVHKSFVTRINRYVAKHESGKDITRKLMSDLQIWLMHHIRNDDKDFAPYVMKYIKRGWVKRIISRFFG